MGYRELAAPAGSGLVCAWFQTVPAGAGNVVQRVVPDGCVDLIWWAEEAELTVAGPDTGPMPTPLASGTTVVGVRFAPGRAGPVLGVPLDALRDARVPLRDLWGPSAAVLAESLVQDARKPPTARSDALAGSSPPTDLRPARQAEMLVTAVMERARAAEPADPMVGAVVAGLAAGASVKDVADAVGLGERQLRRRSLASFGYGPKVLQRVLRFQRALRAARAGRPLADTALEAGYADQAHLSHEVRELAGVPMGVLLGRST